jgi:hypothetical protein
MTDEERVNISITRTGKKKTSNIVNEVLGTKRERTFPADECMFEENSERSFEYSLKKDRGVGLWKDEDELKESDPSGLTYSHTLTPVLKDMTGAMEQRGQLRIRRYDRGDEIVWVVQIDRNRANFLDRTFADFIAFIKRAFNA